MSSEEEDGKTKPGIGIGLVLVYLGGLLPIVYIPNAPTACD